MCRHRSPLLAAKLWHLLGWFLALFFCGSIAGIVATALMLQALKLQFASQALQVAPSPRDVHSENATFYRYFGVVVSAYSIAFICLSIAKLLVLDRFTQHALASATDSPAPSRRGTMQLVIKATTALVAVFGFVSLIAGFVAWGFYWSSAHSSQQAARSCDVVGQDTNSSAAFALEAASQLSNAEIADLAKQTCEVTCLMLIVAMYLIVVPTCAFILNRASRQLLSVRRRVEDINISSGIGGATGSSGFSLRNLEGGKSLAREMVERSLQDAVAQRRRLILSYLIVLVTFFIRAAVDVLLAIAYANRVPNTSCSECGECQPTGRLIFNFVVQHFEIYSLAVVLGSPLPLCASLWLMMLPADRGMLRRGAAVSDDIEYGASFVREKMQVDFPLLRKGADV